MRLADGRTATLVHWPIPYRRDRRGKRPGGAKARVVISGRHYNVETSDVLDVLDEGVPR